MKITCVTGSTSLMKVLALTCLGVAISAPASASALDRPVSASCADLMVPPLQINGKPVGQEDCQMQDAGVVDAARKYRRVEIGVSGTTAGFLVREGPRASHFSSVPEVMFTQMGNHNPRHHGILRYEASKGTSMALIYPEAGWNGKLFVLAHGSSGSFQRGSLKPWDENLDPSRPLADLTRYEATMLAKGYAVARTRRNADRGPGDFSVTLDSGEVVPGLNIANQPEIFVDMALLAQNFLKSRLNRAPSRTYWYGHSGGVMLGRMIYWKPEVNRDRAGKQVFDGFLFDDPGGGMFIPVIMRDGKDILFTSAEDRAKLTTKAIDVSHQLYINRFTSQTPDDIDLKNIPDFVSPVYLSNKRTTAKVMRKKGLESHYRMYEVRDVSHSGGESLPDGKAGDVQILPLWRLMDGVIDILDRWVENGGEPPPTKSDLAELADANSDGIAENAAVALPETACPLGVFYPFPPSMGNGGASNTSFALFDGKSLEPVDGRGVTVDMNLNRIIDDRETVTAAWQRIGLLKRGEKFNRAAYVGCVKNVVGRLKSENLLTQPMSDLYLKEAAEKELPQN